MTGDETGHIARQDRPADQFPWPTASVMAGVPLMVAARSLGHADTKMVEKHYGHLAPGYVVDEIRKGAPKFGFEPDNKVTAIG